MVELVELNLWLAFCSIESASKQRLVEAPSEIVFSLPSDHEEVRVLPELRLAFLEGRLYVLVVELLVVFDVRQVLVAVQDVEVL